MSITNRKTHEYLGMTLRFIGEGKFIINMVIFFSEILDEEPYDMTGVAVIPASDNLFSTHED